ncbi:MBL fold metallo-hydrolase [Marinobacterium sp. YM272]|uniref:MBL fold metallo-hydrolase n=1 Tax=Marinobacterium sp. YM272 TaxID=3421654 RepID=UPI003D7FA9CF
MSTHSTKTLRQRIKTLMFWLAGFLIIAASAIFAYMQHPKFGRLPDGDHLGKIQSSPNYVDGEFRNQIETPIFTGEESFASVVWKNLTSSSAGLAPDNALPSVKVDIRSLDPAEDLLIWLGHSSFYLQLAGKRFLIDPVFGPNAAPVPGMIPAFQGTTPYTVEDFPAIDYLLITHDHWDHLDYPSLTALQSRVSEVITPLGVGAYLQGWGFDSARITEGDWYDEFGLDGDLKIHVIPARHYSGRALKRRQTLWAGFIVESPSYRLLFSGDSGYGPHFTELGNKFERFDLAALDQGQYDDRWANIHMTPEQAALAAEELGAQFLLPSHVGKYALAKHPWQEPFERITEASRNRSFGLVTPTIGKPIPLQQLDTRVSEAWWSNTQG